MAIGSSPDRFSRQSSGISGDVLGAVGLNPRTSNMGSAVWTSAGSWFVTLMALL